MAVTRESPQEGKNSIAAKVRGLKEGGAIGEADQRKGGKREGKDEEGAGKEAKTRD
jgi:hypothetical protein